MVAQLKFLGRIELMEDDRWAKRLLQDIIISSISTPWLKDIARIYKLLEIPEDI